MDAGEGAICIPLCKQKTGTTMASPHSAAMKSPSKAVAKSSPSPADRASFLLERRHRKMTRSAHAYVRGNTAKFYEWLEQGHAADLPEGPSVWICGDCHVGNLGPVASAKGRVGVQIRDVDQTVVGNPAHDLIRLGLSLATAARGSDLPGVTTAHMLEEMVHGYHSAFTEREGAEEGDGHTPKAVARVLKTATRRRWRQLAEERIEDVRPIIPLGERFWALAPEERSELGALFGLEPVHELITSLQGRDRRDPIEVVDAAYWIKGCSSLGRLRYAVLVKVGEDDHCLVDIKEAVPATAPAAPEAKMPRDNAERVVKGARALAPYLGERMFPARLMGRAVVLRELLPQDLKIEIDRLTRPEATLAARFLANVVGRAHARQMDEPLRASWLKELHRSRSKTLDAPSWLWASVVELIGVHEVAYLQHCRRYGADRAA